MKKTLTYLCLIFCLSGCLAGCSAPSEPEVQEEAVDTVTEVQTKLSEFAMVLSQEGALDSIRKTIAEGILDESVLDFSYDDMIVPSPSLNSSLVPQPDTLSMGYDWKTKTYTCLFTCLSDKEKAYIVARFDENFVCYSFSASPIITIPYVTTPESQVDDESIRDYIPRPAIPEEG